MGLSIWSEEGNQQDLSYFFPTTQAEVKAGQAPDTPDYLDETRYVKAYERQTEAPRAVNILPFLIFAVLLYFLGGIKL